MPEVIQAERIHVPTVAEKYNLLRVFNLVNAVCPGAGEIDSGHAGDVSHEV